MDLEEVKTLVSQGETESVEFKKTTTQRRPAAKTVCGMLNNASGGFVFFGVSDKGELKGQEVTSKTLEELSGEFRLLSPPAFPKIKTVSLTGKLKIIIIEVNGSSEGTYTYNGRPYLKYGTTTSVMPREEYTKRLIEQVHTNHRWENEPAPDWVNVSDLDEEEVQTTLKNAIALGRMMPVKDTGTESILKGLGLIRNGQLLNAAIALYGKNEEFIPQFPQLSIRLARFRGVDRLSDFSDSREYWGHAFGLLRRSESFLLDHMPIAGRVVPGKMVREDYPMYPPRAFREAVANAIFHRDYTTAGGSVAIAIYDDHLEVINPGSFHFDITPERLVVPHESKPWNPLVAQVFYRTGIIEKWGTGTLNIIDWCQGNSNPQPKWEERTDSVITTFYPSVALLEKDQESDSRPKLRPKLRPKSSTKTIEEAIIKLLEEEGAMSSSEIANVLGHEKLSGGIKKAIKKLLENEEIAYTIPDKPRSRLQKYVINKRRRL